LLGEQVINIVVITNQLTTDYLTNVPVLPFKLSHVGL